MTKGISRRGFVGSAVSNAAGPFRTFGLQFAPVTGDVLRIVGSPGGTAKFTSIGELAVYPQ